MLLTSDANDKDDKVKPGLCTNTLAFTLRLMDALPPNEVVESNSTSGEKRNERRKDW